MRTLLFVITMVIGIVCEAPERAEAQDAYRWIDKHGNIVYGTKPPKGASDVKSIKTPRLSRYNSDKVLNRLGWRGARRRIDEGDRPAAKPDTEASAGSAPAKQDLPFSSGPAALEAAEPDIVTDEAGEITACSVRVKNTGQGAAQEVSVAFEFPDRTLVPASGPDTLEANGEAVYAVPEGILPIKLKTEGAPRVIVHGATR